MAAAIQPKPKKILIKIHAQGIPFAQSCSPQIKLSHGWCGDGDGVEVSGSYEIIAGRVLLHGARSEWGRFAPSLPRHPCHHLPSSPSPSSCPSTSTASRLASRPRLCRVSVIYGVPIVPLAVLSPHRHASARVSTIAGISITASIGTTTTARGARHPLYPQPAVPVPVVLAVPFGEGSAQSIPTFPRLHVVAPSVSQHWPGRRPIYISVQTW